jgi:hypothetical protein
MSRYQALPGLQTPIDLLNYPVKPLWACPAYVTLAN